MKIVDWGTILDQTISVLAFIVGLIWGKGKKNPI